MISKNYEIKVIFPISSLIVVAISLSKFVCFRHHSGRQSDNTNIFMIRGFPNSIIAMMTKVYLTGYVSAPVPPHLLTRNWHVLGETRSSACHNAASACHFGSSWIAHNAYYNSKICHVSVRIRGNRSLDIYYIYIYITSILPTDVLSSVAAAVKKSRTSYFLAVV